jgi:hypothetical protein
LLNRLLCVGRADKIIKLNELLLSISKVVVLEIRKSGHNFKKVLLNFRVDWVGSHMIILLCLDMGRHGLYSFGSEPAIGIGLSYA